MSVVDISNVHRTKKNGTLLIILISISSSLTSTFRSILSSSMFYPVAQANK